MARWNEDYQRDIQRWNRREIVGPRKWKESLNVAMTIPIESGLLLDRLLDERSIHGSKSGECVIASEYPKLSSTHS